MLSRIKFEIEPLVNEMLDCLPKEVWTSKTTTFLDPVIAGGQFVRAIERRLFEAGHSKQNISKRVFGIEEYEHQIQFAVNKHKLIGSYAVTDFLEQDFKDMKFDVVLGNPPFKKGNEVGGKSSLWRSVVGKSWSLVKDNGYIAMIAPQLPNTAKDLGHIFTEHQTTTVWTKIEHHFPNIGSSFRAWIVNKSVKKNKTNFINEGLKLDITNKQFPEDLNSIAIIDKFLNNIKFECVSSPEYYHTSVADGNNDAHMFSKPSPKHPYLLRRTSGENYYIYGAVEPTDYYSPKVVMTYSGNPHYQYHGKTNPIGTIKYQSGHILVKNKTEGENLISLYQTSLYRFVQSQLSKGGMKGSSYYSLPKLDLSKKWSDKEVYKAFNLTKEEIDYVESNVK